MRNLELKSEHTKICRFLWIFFLDNSEIIKVHECLTIILYKLQFLFMDNCPLKELKVYFTSLNSALRFNEFEFKHFSVYLNYLHFFVNFVCISILFHFHFIFF